MIMDSMVKDRHTSPMRRLTEGSLRWRVLVETWSDRETYHGRLVFRQDVADGGNAERESATLLHGRSREDVVARAHDLPEEHLRRVLYSLA